MKSFPKFFGVFFCAITFSSAGWGQAKLKSAQVRFVTPTNTDNKDWNTKVTVTLYLSDGTKVGVADNNSCTASSGTQAVAACFCCVKPITNAQGGIIDYKTSFLDNDSERGPFEITVSNPISKQSIQSGYFVVSITPVGNDRWIFVPKLTLNFDDGSTKTFTQLSRTIVSQDSRDGTVSFH
jgi:hypothetical protein